MKKNKKNNNVLIALMPNKSDFEIAKTLYWYRIPVRSAPQIVKNNLIKYIAFYHTKVFEREKFSIRYYTEVNKISIVKRKNLLPDQPFDLKSENDYYKIEFSPLSALPQPIVSLRHRRLLFIPTSEEKLFNAKEINYLFNDSPLEEILWKEFIRKRITAERQLYIPIKNNKYFLDFAVFCKTRNINIECDGDKYHTQKVNVQSDKRRNNLLESYGWAVLRFTTFDIKYEMNSTLNIISNSINKHGGLQDIKNFENYKYILGPNDTQLLLFE